MITMHVHSSRQPFVVFQWTSKKVDGHVVDKRTNLSSREAIVVAYLAETVDGAIGHPFSAVLWTGSLEASCLNVLTNAEPIYKVLIFTGPQMPLKIGW